MAIPVECPECGQAYQMKDAAAGKSFACPACGASVAVPYADTCPRPPAPVPEPAESAPVLTEVAAELPPPLRVVVVDIDVPFASLAWLLLKASFALGLVGVLLVGLYLAGLATVLVVTSGH